MKSRIAIIVLSCVSFIFISAAVLFWFFASDLYSKNTELEKQVVTLQNDVTLRDGIITDMEKKAYPKSFENQKMLEKWLQTTSDKSHFEYYSESAVELMKEARDDGYWMGLAPADFIYDGTGLPQRIEYPLMSRGVVMCLTVVGGDTIYLVDPDALSVLKVTTMQADFDLNDLKIK